MTPGPETSRLGAWHLGHGRTRFDVWAPCATSVELSLLGPEPRLIPLQRLEAGHFVGTVEGAPPGSRYLYRLDEDQLYPDPASRYQPEGVRGPSEVIDGRGFEWSDEDWRGPILEELVLYELHAGTFTGEGTLDAIVPRLDELRGIGINAIELMPVAQFSGSRNWGYDGVFSFAVHNSYGGPAALMRLVDACHGRGLAVFLDVVFNHLGPEGGCLQQFGPYFHEACRTPWGAGINYDGPWSDGVRRYFLENAIYWLEQFHVDGLRLDAIHSIYDQSATPFLAELSEVVHRRAGQRGRRVLLIAESDRNDARIVQPTARGGLGMDSQWSDDLHYALHALLTGERAGYYQDAGRVADLAAAWRDGFALTGQYSGYRRRRHGSPCGFLPGTRFVVCAQNHDQIGNRPRGERLGSLVSFESLKLAAAVVLLSRFVPLLFMGEEYGERAPFEFFVSHEDAGVLRAVRRGRKREAAHFGWSQQPRNPRSPATFRRARLREERRRTRRGRALQGYYRELIALRRGTEAFRDVRREAAEVAFWEQPQLLLARRGMGGRLSLLVFHFGEEEVEMELPFPSGSWRKVLDSADKRWLGPGSRMPETIGEGRPVHATLAPRSAVVYVS